MRTVLLLIVLYLTLTCIADSAPLSEADLKNLLAAIRQVQADTTHRRRVGRRQHVHTGARARPARAGG